MDQAAQTKPDENTPEWMIKLEARLRVVRETYQLGHEMGAGSPCTKCGDGCSGFQLHFWRKLCIVCKCKKEDHNLEADDVRIRSEILLVKDGARAVVPHKGELYIRMEDNESKLPSNRQTSQNVPKSSMKKRVALDWIPPNVSNEMAAEYMDQLPAGKLPISGSDGAFYRKTQLDKQIPLYDIAPEMSKMKPGEKNSFFKYLKDVRDSAVGLGRIQRLVPVQFKEGSVPYCSLPEPLNAHVLRKGKKEPDEHENITGQRDHYNNMKNMPRYQSCLPKYRPPPSFSATCQPLQSPEMTSNPHVIPTTQLKLPSAFIPDRPNSRTGHSSIPFPDTSTLNNQNNNENHFFDKSFLEGVPDVDPRSSEINEAGRDSLPSSNLIKGNVGVPNNEAGNNPNRRDLESTQQQGSHVTDPEADVANKYMINNQYGFDSHPEGYVPSPGQDRNTHSRRRVDLDNANHIVAPVEHAGNESVLPVERAMNCYQCKEEVPLGSVAVMADRAGKGVIWHPQCFVCDVCQELLVDLVYFFHKKKVYCGRHYAEMKNIPRCSTCDELIFTNSYILTQDKNYHTDHYRCLECNSELADMDYVDVDNQPVCLSCYMSIYGKRCMACNIVMQVDEKWISYKGKDWHNSPDCFKCAQCKKSLINEKFILIENNPLCSKQCIEAFVQK